jgi:hypothetical protein
MRRTGPIQSTATQRPRHDLWQPRSGCPNQRGRSPVNEFCRASNPGGGDEPGLCCRPLRHGFSGCPRSAALLPYADGGHLYIVRALPDGPIPILSSSRGAHGRAALPKNWSPRYNWVRLMMYIVHRAHAAPGGYRFRSRAATDTVRRGGRGHANAESRLHTASSAVFDVH